MTVATKAERTRELLTRLESGDPLAEEVEAALDDARLRLLRAIELAAKRKDRAALADLRKIRTAAPEDPFVRIAVGLIAGALGRYFDGREDFQVAAKHPRFRSRALTLASRRNFGPRLPTLSRTRQLVLRDLGLAPGQVPPLRGRE